MSFNQLLFKTHVQSRGMSFFNLDSIVSELAFGKRDLFITCFAGNRKALLPL